MLKQPTPLIGIVDLLLWNADTIGIAALRREFDDHVAQLFYCGHFLDAEDSVVAAISALPASAQRKFFQSPQIVSQVIRWRRDGTAPDRGALGQLALAELALAGLTHDLPISVWTSRGDMRLASGSSLDKLEETPWLIDGEIAIDDASPQTFPYDGTGPKLLLPLDAADAKKATRVLSEAMRALLETCPPAYEFVTTFLKQISIRLEPGVPTRFNSSSFSQFVGLALLNNPHVEKADVANVSEALVHEAIHSMLFMIEEIEEPFLLDRAAASIMVKSPWSGAHINLHAYVHACVVWYGLFQLWEKLECSSVFPAAKRRALSARALSGFTYNPLAEILPHRGQLSRRAVELLDAVNAVVNDNLVTG